MRKMLLLVLITGLFGACASTPYPDRFTHSSWVDDINPASKEKSDWDIIDLNERTFSERNDALSDMGHTAKNLLW